MTKLWILVFFLFLLKSQAGTCIENSDTIKVSKKINLPNSEEIIEIVGYDNSGTYLLKKDYSYILEKYDQDFNLSGSVHLNIYKGLRSRNFEKIVLFHDSLYLFISEIRISKTNLYVQRIDKQTLKPICDEKLIYSTPNIKGNYPGFEINYSWLRNKLLIVAKTDFLQKKSIIFEYLVFTEGMEKLWYRKDFYVYNHQTPRNITYTVDEKGNVFMFALIYEVPWLSHFNDPLKNQYIVVRYLNNGKTSNNYIFDFKNRYARDAKLIAGTNGTLTIAGFVSDNYKFGISGVFIQTLDTVSMNIKPMSIYKFKPVFLNEIDKSGLFKDGEVYGFSLKQLVLRENGDKILLCEQIFEQDYDNANQILAFGFNQYDEMIWKTVIRKKQSGTSHVSFSLIAPSTLNNIKIVYNESTSNSLTNEAFERKSFFYLDDSYICLKEIDNRGFIISDSLRTLQNKEPVFEPKYTFDNRNGEIIAIAIRYRVFQFIRLNLFPK